MSVDIASLVMAVDSRQVAEGTKNLDAMALAGKKAEASTLALEAANKVLAAAARTVSSAFAAYKIMDLIRDSAMLAARFETMGVVMKVAGNNAGYTRSQMEEYSKALQKSGISMMESRNVLTQLATANIDLANAAKLGRAAQDLAVVANINSSEALARVTHGIKSNSVEVLQTMGLNVRFEDSYKKMAAQLGTTSEKLTEQQRVMARTNAVLAEATKLQGIYEESMTTAGKAMTSLTRYWDDFKVKAGEAFLPALALGVFTLTDALKAMNEELVSAGQGGTIDAVGSAFKSALVVTLQTVAVLAANVVYTLTSIGREMGGIVAQFSAMGEAGGIFTQAGRNAWSVVGAEMRKDAEASAKALKTFEDRVMSLGTTTATVATTSETARIAAGKAAREAAEAAQKEAAARAAAAEAAKKLAGEQAAFVKGLEKEAAAIGRSSEEKKLQEAVTLKLTGAVMNHVQALIVEMAQYKAASDAAQKRADARNKEYDDVVAFIAAEQLRSYEAVNAADKAVAQAQKEYDQHGLLKSAVLELGLFELERRAKNLTAGTVAYENLQREIEAQKKLISIAKGTEVRDASEKAAKEAADEWKKASDQVQQSLSDALMNAFTAGKGFGKTFVNSIKAMFNTMVLRPVISAIVGTVTGSLGLGGTANAATGGGSLLSNGSSLFNTASSLGGIFGSTAAYAGAIGGGSMAAGSQAAMLAAQTGVFGAEGLAMTASAAGGMAGAMAPVLQGLMTAAPYLAAVAAVYMIAKSLDHSGTPHTGGGSSYSAAGGLQQASSGAIFNSGFTGIDYSANTEEFTTGIVKSVVQILDTTATTFGKTAGYQAAASFADDSSKDGAWGSLFIRNMEQVLTDWQAGGQSFRTFSDGTAGNNEFLAAVTQDVRAALDGIDLPEWADKMLGKLGASASLEDLSKVVSEINQTQAVLQSLGASVKVFAGLSGEAVLGIINASGGLQAFGASLGAYYENFYSEQEKFDAKLGALNTRLRDLAGGGAFADSAAQFNKLITEPTRENFRKLIEAQDLTTTSGQNTYAALLGLSGVVAELTPVAEQAAEAVQTLGTAALTLADVQKLFDSSAKTLLNAAQYSAYRIQQIQATLGAAGMDLSAQQIASLTREQVLAGYQQALAAGNLAAASAILNVVDALAEVSTGFQGVTETSTSAAVAVQQVVTTLADVQTLFGSAARTLLNDVQYTAYQVAQIQATLGSVGINVTAADIQNATREQVLAGLSEMMAAGNLDAARAILSVVGALSEVSSGFQTVAATASNAAAVMQQRAGLESTLLNLTGNTAAIRARELAALDASNRGLQQHIYAIQDAQQAIQDAQQAVSDATSAYQAQESAIASLQSAAQRWIGTMNTATSLLDQISGALGGAGGNREAALWATVNGAGDIDARLSAAQELFSVITQTAATEQAAQDNALANAKALLEYGQRLRDYVQGLKTGDLSTLTPAQKVAEALAQYQTTLAAAQGGDQTALGNLQGVADTYLRLAREFDPASYTASVFTSVTSALDSLGAGLISQNQPQIDLLQSQLDATNAASASANSLSADQIARLQTLQGVVQDLYAQAGAQSAIANAQVSSAQANLQSLGAARLAAQQALAVQQQAVVTAQQAATAYMATLADVAVTDPVPDILRSLPEGIAAALAPLINANPASTAAATAATTAQRAQIIRDYAATLPQDDTGARMLYDAAVANGVSSAELDAAMGFAAGSSLAWAVSHGLPAFAQGTNYVPADMVAQIHKGEAIVPARYNPANGGNAALEAKLEAVLAELKSLREQNNAGHLMGAQATHENTKQITHATERGASQLAHTQRLQQRAVVA